MTKKTLFKMRAVAKPFLKWVGGKRQLIPQYKKYFPEDFGNYLEPFVGGGAIFFYLHKKNLINQKAFLIDNNEALINTYKVIKDSVGDLIDLLKEFEKNYNENSKEFYYEIRAWDRKKDFSERSDLEKAARIVFLNRTCFNGLYRVNQKGQFNVPIGRYKNPTICDENLLLSVSEVLKDSKLFCDDFSLCSEFAKKGDLVYFDPPYQPISESSSFTSYTKDDFNENDQKRLKNTFKQLSKKGCYVMLSNSDTPLINELYKEFEINKVYAKRNVNSNADKRGEITEVLVTNY